MKKTLSVLILSVFLSFQSFAGGGPDAFGYVWYNDSDTSIVAYNWIDITTKPGVVITSGLADDNSIGPFAIGFDFHYYWGDFNAIKLGSNGWFSFGNTGNIASCFPTILNPSAPHNYIAPSLSDLNFAPDGATPNPGAAYYWTNNADTFIVSYENVPFWTTASPHTGFNTFQVILCKTDSSVTFQYGQVEQALVYPCNGTGTTDWKFVQGIKAINGTTGLQVNATQDNLPSDFSTVKFFYPDSILLQITDVSAHAGLNIENGGEFVIKGEKFIPTAYVSNVGNVDITTTTTVNAVVAGLGYTSSTTIPQILQGEVLLVQFPDTLNPSTAGAYGFNISAQNSLDANAGNNTNSVELSVVEPDINGRVRLSYASAATPFAGISWGGTGNDGAGIKIDPPFYPFVIRAMEHYVTADANNTGYSGEVRIPGPSGNPGPVVANVSVPSGSFTLNSWHNVALQDSVKIDSNAVFISWIQGGAGVTLGAEDPSINPNGNRTYEVIAGAWAPYRNAGSDAYIAIYVDTPSVQAPLGLEGTFANNLSLYPNPSSGLFYVSGEVINNEPINWTISDQFGRSLRSFSAIVKEEKMDLVINLSDNPAGIYYLILGGINGKKVFKLVKN
jgi:Secretion system C-terminal sorting domain